MTILFFAKNEIPYQSLDWKKIKLKLRWKPKHLLYKKVNTIKKWYSQAL